MYIIRSIILYACNHRYLYVHMYIFIYRGTHTQTQLCLSDLSFIKVQVQFSIFLPHPILTPPPYPFLSHTHFLWTIKGSFILGILNRQLCHIKKQCEGGSKDMRACIYTYICLMLTASYSMSLTPQLYRSNVADEKQTYRNESCHTMSCHTMRDTMHTMCASCHTLSCHTMRHTMRSLGEGCHTMRNLVSSAHSALYI